MNKRNLAIALWFLMGWTIGSVLAFMLGLPTLVGGVPLAIASTALMRTAGQRLWPMDSATARTASVAATRAPLASE
jgi:hypothetical protein